MIINTLDYYEYNKHKRDKNGYYTYYKLIIY